ncbi:hypothetical protein [Clostridium lundense]|uniref:hypothetical protein n=1 Tax=Clostridium lundense TaxID=319475 RepID=UPI0004816307|nr:hypothetical protein [Clostridium lundense]
MKLEILKDKTILILGGITMIFTLLTLNNIYFISKTAQNIYYLIYIILSSLLIITLSKRYNTQINQSFLIPIYKYSICKILFYSRQVSI